MEEMLELTDAQKVEMVANNVKKANSQLGAMEYLDKASFPIEGTIYLGEGKFTYRNDAYRKMVSEMDLKGKEELKRFVKTNDIKLMDRLFRRK